MTVKGLEKWGDRVKECKLNNGNTKYFVEYDRIDFEIAIKIRADNEHEEKMEVFSQVDENFINLLSGCIHSGRYRIWYGDTQTGRSWNEEYDVTGVIGRTSGHFKVPVLLHDRRSTSGDAILVGRIIRIDNISTKTTVWKHKNFHVEKFYLETTEDKNYPYAVMQLKDSGALGNVVSFKTEDQANRWINFMYGKRYCK